MSDTPKLDDQTEATVNAYGMACYAFEAGDDNKQMVATRAALDARIASISLTNAQARYLLKWEGLDVWPELQSWLRARAEDRP